MNEVVNFLSENPVLYLATIGRDGKPKVRPFQFMLEKDGKLFFCTSNQKEVYKEIKLNPYVEFSTTNQNNVWIRISGRIKFSNDLEVKTTIIEHNPLVKSIYKTPDNPIFEIFYLDDAKAVIADFSGQPPKQYNL
ncbi:pyridoxamine 5'-phosphate oxidase-related FMN-binding protein [Thermoanaerobacterium thermosaccharolyticum]|uniref:Pyridoxamine 5'-phosphate oxidase-related FMN-binding protein n=1 Tax=Thermoanaerobacterium thermosaccharolyticum TaxID=1517 RepID=A0A223I0N4_THETR|nr:pyridoxamine 5'-phosphate oxidase family protein [Thermoanaerobacterium thermosaccharolyticum]AST58075.1 pyridoxamine 5'-phosphate oxidase-related FMN-binding protein [Thermoanaerobacterium thermosaccharolyticum]